MLSVQEASQRKNVQSNAAVYFADSQELQDDNNAALESMRLQIQNDTANSIIEWCSCTNYKDNMAQETTRTFSVGMVDGNVITQWQSDLTSKGYTVTLGTVGDAVSQEHIDASPGCLFSTNQTLTITLP